MAVPMQNRDVRFFLPETTAIPSRAIDDTCDALHIAADKAHDRQIVVARIVDLARSGMVDAVALRNRVLHESTLAI